MTIYRAIGGVNREIKQQYRGVGGVNREIKEQYRGVGGVNRKVFQQGVNLPLIYDSGKENISNCGGLISGNKTYTYGTIIKNADKICMAVGGSNGWGSLVTVNPISLAGYSKMHCILSGYAYNPFAGQYDGSVRWGTTNHLDYAYYPSYTGNTGRVYNEFYGMQSSVNLPSPTQFTRTLTSEEKSNNRLIFIDVAGSSTVYNFYVHKIWLE